MLNMVAGETAADDQDTPCTKSLAGMVVDSAIIGGISALSVIGSGDNVSYIGVGIAFLSAFLFQLAWYRGIKKAPSAPSE